MVELIEYVLVVAVSSLFVAGSLLVYGGFTAFESGLSLRAAFGGVSGLISKAVLTGDATATMAFPASTIACQDGTLTMKVGGSALNETISPGCSFVVSIPAGVHTLEVRDNSSRLELSVT